MSSDCHLMRFRKGGGEMLQGYGSLCGGGFCHRKLLLYGSRFPSFQMSP